MAYRIDYGTSVPRKRTGGGNFVRFQMMTAAFLLLFTLLVSQKWPAGAAKLREFLLPGESAVQTAFQEFVTGMQEGESVETALTAFCRQIIENAQAS